MNQETINFCPEENVIKEECSKEEALHFIEDWIKTH